jgi:hypothetical protein
MAYVILPCERSEAVEDNSLFAERAHQLVVQRLDQIGDQRALAGLDEGLDRHARREPGAIETLGLAGIEIRTR